MWPAAAVSVLVTVAVLALIFRRSLRGRYRRPPAEPIPHRGLLIMAMIVCGCPRARRSCWGSTCCWPPPWPRSILVVGCAVGQPQLLTWRLLPWQLVLGVGVLFVVVQFAHDHGLGSALSIAAGHGETWPALLRMSRAGAARGQPDRQPAGLSRPRACRDRLPAAAGGPAGRRQRRSADHAVGQPGDPALGGALPLGRRHGVVAPVRLARRSARAPGGRGGGHRTVAGARLRPEASSSVQDSATARPDRTDLRHAGISGQAQGQALGRPPAPRGRTLHQPARLAVRAPRSPTSRSWPWCRSCCSRSRSSASC